MWLAVEDERRQLYALLRNLPLEQWESPSLCSGWRVRDVVGHLCSLNHQWRTYMGPTIIGTLRSGFSPNRFWDRDARRWGASPPDALLDKFERSITERRHPLGPGFPLAEVVVHGQDIAVPLGLPREVPVDRLLAVADQLRLPGYPSRRRAATHGVRLEAIDVPWARGRGPVVRGPMLKLVLAMAERPIDLHELAGEGVHILAARLQH
jgi:uncharacterized protein (TIGR03083 family)